MTEVEEIFKADLEISSVRVKDDKIEISCNQHDLRFDYCGGDLIINCDGIKIYDQEWNEIQKID